MSKSILDLLIKNILYKKDIDINDINLNRIPNNVFGVFVTIHHQILTLQNRMDKHESNTTRRHPDG